MRNEDDRRVRVLAADDSAVMREVMRTIFSREEESSDGLLPRMELCGVARDGIEAVEQAVALRPDVLVLDLEMPRLNGLGVLEQLRTLAPELPVILCSSYTEHGARTTLDALAHGAKDYVTKPEHQRNFEAALESLRRQLFPKIAALARGRHSGHQGDAPHKHSEDARAFGTQGEGAEAVVIGISTGGPPALETLLPALPRDFPVPVLVVQHMPRLFTGALAERLNRLCRMPVEEARDGMRIEPGKILLAPGDKHMEVTTGLTRSLDALRGGGSCRIRVVRLRAPELPTGGMPSVDLLFRSAARAYGSRTLAVVMTGMGSDGLEGAAAIRAAGGTVLAQDQASSAVWGMPARVAEAGLAAAVLPLEAIAGELIERVGTVRKAVDVRREIIYGVL